MNTLHLLTDDQRRVFETRGGYSLGMEMAQEHGPEFGFSIPQQYTHLLGDKIRYDDILDLFPLGFGIKRSGTDESFSFAASRGTNSSRNNFWDGDDRKEGVAVIENVINEDVSANRKSLVFQQYIRGAKVTVHATDQRVTCEADMDTARGILILDDESDEVLETVPSEIFQEDISFSTLRGLAHAIKSMRSTLPFDCDIELIVEGDTRYITQLRPLPDAHH